MPLGTKRPRWQNQRHLCTAQEPPRCHSLLRYENGHQHMSSFGLFDPCPWLSPFRLPLTDRRILSVRRDHVNESTGDNGGLNASLTINLSQNPRQAQSDYAAYVRGASTTRDSCGYVPR